jgi:hypothetical protein
LEELQLSAFEYDVKPMKLHIAEPLLPEPSCYEVEIATADLKKCKSSGIDQIPAELFQAGGETSSSEGSKHVNFINCIVQYSDRV